MIMFRAMKGLFYLLPFLCVVAGVLIEECPPKEMTHCTCTLRTGPSLLCYKIKNLERTLYGMKDYSIKQLTLSSTNIPTIPEDLFKGLHIENLFLDRIEVQDASFRPGRQHFTGLENTLVHLEILESFRMDRHLLNLKLDHLKRLKSVLLEDNTIPVVGNDWFPNGPKTLSTLIFERNGIEELGDKAFQSLSGLGLLAVAGNHLTDFSRSMFPSPALKLEKFDLAYNKIRTLPKDLFSGMPSLKEVNIGFNLIHQLSEDTWSTPLLSLKNLIFEGNPLHCDNHLKWVCEQDYNVITAKCLAPAEKSGQLVKQFCNSF